MTLFLFLGVLSLVRDDVETRLLLTVECTKETLECSMALSVMPGVIVERVGNDLMVIVPGNTDVVTLSGRPAEVLLDVRAGRKVDPTDAALRDLVDLGIVSTPGLSRRGLVKAGAIGAGAGIAVLAMPGVASASSISCQSASFDVGVGTQTDRDRFDDGELLYEEVRLLISFSNVADIPPALETGQTGTWVWTTAPTAYPDGVTVTWGGNPSYPNDWVFENTDTGFDLSPLQAASGPSSPDDRHKGTLTFSIGGCDYVGTSDGIS
jgi:hypothetical protein